LKQTEALHKQLESERQQSRSKKERVKELLSAATVVSDIAYAKQLAKVCS
jgi:hypothetical protein